MQGQTVNSRANSLEWIRTGKPGFYFETPEGFYFASRGEKTRLLPSSPELQNFLDTENNFLILRMSFEGELTLVVPDQFIFGRYERSQPQHPQSDTKKIPSLSWRSSFPEKDQWLQWVARAQEAFSHGDLEKIVLSRESTFDISGADAFETALALLNQSQSGYRILSGDENSWFFSTTPELLFRYQDGCLGTVALAGTMSAEKLESELLTSQKDQREHSVVVNFIREKLEKLGLDVSVFKQTCTHLPGVIHLKTPIQAKPVARNRLFEILSELHPTPAVCGFPREISRPWIRSCEGRTRGQYAGVMGILTKDFWELAVTIRSGSIENEKLRVTAGAGLIAESDAHEEWKELDLKLGNILGNLL